MTYQCEQCGSTFPKLSELLSHRRLQNHWKIFDCDVCGKWFTRKDNLNQHKRKHEEPNNMHCDKCGKVFSRIYHLNRHRERVHQVGKGRKRPADDVEERGGPRKQLRKKDKPEDFYTIKRIKEQTIEKFKTNASTYKVTFQDIEVTEDVVLTLRRLFSALFGELTRGAKSEDLVRVTVQSPSLDYPISIPFLKVNELTADRFMSELERVLQSNEDFLIDSGLIIEVTLVDMPNGGARKHCKFVNTEKFCLDKRCILQIRNNDDLCCARAIVTAKAKLDKHEQWNSIRQGRGIQKDLALQLHDKAHIPVGECGISEIKHFQDVLPGYQINVVSREHFNAIIYSGPESEKKIYLYLHDDHYDVITSMAAFLTKSYYCTQCQKGYDQREKHKCNDVCHRCRKIHEDETDARWRFCEACNRYFKGELCFQMHLNQTKKGNSTCKDLNRCKDCGTTVYKRKRVGQHECGEIFCEVCKAYFTGEHLCYMLPDHDKEEEKSAQDHPVEDDEPQTFIFFDFECTQDDIVQCEMGYSPNIENKRCLHCQSSTCGAMEHLPNMCLVHKVCTLCLDSDLTEISECEHCGTNERIFSGQTTLDEFCKWLFSEENYNATAICHNFQGYDSYPILRYLHNNGIIPTIITNGAKIMSLQVPCCKLKMIDSINFLPMALSKLPEMFGISELAKGYFPHLYNKKDNQHTILSHLPDAKFYNPDAMKPDDRSAFLVWYTENKGKSFDFQSELVRYCRSDVDILRRCCLKFRENFMEVTQIDPFEKSITIASACQRVFRTKFLEKDCIGIIPTHGYNPNQNQSTKALQWLKYMSHTTGHQIQHARNGGEKRIGDYLVDGYYETADEKKVVLEFNGDFWHGNPKKFASTTRNPVSKFTMGELYQKTLDKQRYLEENGYTYISIWESDFDKELSENEHMAAYIRDMELVTPIQPRDAFFGGRTEAYTMYKETSETEKINYYDVTSLYPFINKTGKVPLGHPEIITEHFQDVNGYEGLIKCKVVPPKGLYHPILPCKLNNKLLFALCRTCAETNQQTPCSHSEDEREFIGTWVTDELKKAKQAGYKVKTIYEVWHFPRISQYDPCTKTGGVFTEYINTFLKIKQEASGWPKWCKSEEQKQSYIQSYYDREGIWLDYKNIEKNPGMRALAKLMLNSFWGKFGQRSNMAQVEITDDPSVYFDKLTSDCEEVVAVNYVSEEAVELRWRFKDDFVEPSGKTNVVIAAYTTAQARLKLYSYLEMLGQRALYADTDSVVFTTGPGERTPSLGDFLGDLTDETPNNSITTFVTGGPKNYAYQLAHPDEEGKLTHCKIRGFTLNHKNLLSINFHTLTDMVRSESKGVVTVKDSFKIIRDRTNTKLLTTSQTKDYRLVFDKRVVRDQFISYPYGF